MKIIKVTTDCAIKIIKINESISKLLNKELNSNFEIVYPRRLTLPYCMIVDENGQTNNLPVNPIGSYFYESDINYIPIVGDIIILKVEGGNLVGLNDFEAMNLKKGIEKIIGLVN